MMDETNLKVIIQKANEKISSRHWKVYEDDIKIFGNYVRFFFQAKSLVDLGVFDDQNTIYGIGIFLVHIDTYEFHDVACIEEIEETARRLNENESL